MTKILKLSSVAFLKAFACLPFPVIYLISDFLYLIIFHLVGYRKKVVYTNLKNSFPEKNAKEIDQIARRFYHHFCDMTLESIKTDRITEKQLDERLKLKGLEKMEEYFKQKKSVILLGMHYCTWEWSSTLQRVFPHKILMIYNPVRDNVEMERFLLNMRERFGGTSVPVHQSARAAMQFDQSETPGCLWLAADQTPFQNSQFWTTFLNQETPFFSGPEKIAHKTNQPVFFHHTRKLSRGKYEVTLTEIVPEPANETGTDILLKYVEGLENAIKEAPEYWLWSHRRWKHKRPEDIKLIPRK